MDPMDELARNIVQRIEKQKECVETLYGLLWMRLREASPLVDSRQEAQMADLKQGIDKLRCLAGSATSSSFGQRHPCLSASAETLLCSSTTSSLDKSSLEHFRSALDLLSSQCRDVHQYLVILRSQSPTAELDECLCLLYRHHEEVRRGVINFRHLVDLLESSVTNRGQDEMFSSTSSSVAFATPGSQPNRCPEDVFTPSASSSTSFLPDELPEVSRAPLETSWGEPNWCDSLIIFFAEQDPLPSTWRHPSVYAVYKIGPEDSIVLLAGPSNVLLAAQDSHKASPGATQTVKWTSPAQKTSVATKKSESMNAEWVSAALIRHLEAHTSSSYWLWTLKKEQHVRLSASLLACWKPIFCCEEVYQLWSARSSGDINSWDLRPLQLELGRPAGGG